MIDPDFGGNPPSGVELVPNVPPGAFGLFAGVAIRVTTANQTRAGGRVLSCQPWVICSRWNTVPALGSVAQVSVTRPGGSSAPGRDDQDTHATASRFAGVEEVCCQVRP